MITEDYISFDIAKLLKEKGFDADIDLWYNSDGEIFHLYHYDYNTTKHFACVQCPTIQMAMKWLREVHRIDIEVRTHYLNYLKPNDTRYYSGKILKGSEDVIHTVYSKDTYEEVCEAAILYTIKNLI